MPVVSKAEFIAELNRRLQEHPAFEPGMNFTHFPPHVPVENATGYDWTPTANGQTHPFIAVVDDAKADGWGI